MQLAFVAFALAAVAFVLWLSSLSKALRAASRVASLLVENGSLAEQVKTLSTEQKKSAKLLEQRGDELIEIKKEIGALKKKNFSLQEDARKTKTSFEAKLEEREKQLVARPAFEDAEAEKPKAESRKPKADDRPTHTDDRRATTDDRSPTTDNRQPTAEVAAAKADAELTRRIDNLSNENGDLSARLGKLDTDLREALSEQRRLKKKVDDYRRADLVAKSRLDLANDKLGTMGRQYYDAISELAALKGQTAPKPPAELKAEPAGDDAEPEEGGDVTALSHELVGVLQQRDSH